MAETAEAFFNDMLRGIHKVQLFIILQKRNGAAKPPKGGNDKGNGQSGHLGDADFIGTEYKNETDDKRNTAADITPRIAFGGNIIHALRGGDIVNHGIVKDKAGGISHLGDDEQNQEQQPIAGKAKNYTADDTDHERNNKNRFFKSFCVCDRAQNGT